MSSTEYLRRKTRVSDELAAALAQVVRYNDIVVDVGCGAGRVAEHLEPIALHIYGIDLNVEVMEGLEIETIDGDANSDEVWKRISYYNTLVSCDAINKVGCRLESLVKRIYSNTRVVFKIQLSDDLSGMIGPGQLYTVDEIKKLLPQATVTPLRFRQKFSSSSYLKKFLTCVGLTGNVPEFDVIRVYERSYAIVTIGGQNG